MNVVKSKIRNRLQIRMLEAILQIRSNLQAREKNCVTYDISEDMIRAFRSNVFYNGEWPEGL